MKPLTVCRNNACGGRPNVELLVARPDGSRNAAVLEHEIDRQHEARCPCRGPSAIIFLACSIRLRGMK